MNLYLFLAAAVIVACVFCNRVSNKFGVPMLLAFILLGMFFGSDGVVRIPFDNFKAAEQICSIALIFIMFYGGYGTKWSAAKPVVGRAVLLSTAGVVFTAGLTGLFCFFALKMELAESFLIGSLISSTDAASVFSILRSRRLNLKYRTASLLEVESGSNDPCSYMLTTILLGVMSKSGISAGMIVTTLLLQILFGLGSGILLAYITAWILKKFPFTTEGFDAIFVFGMVLLSYAISTAIGGNGYLSAYLFGIFLGNRKQKANKALIHFFDGITGLMQMLLFFTGTFVISVKDAGNFWYRACNRGLFDICGKTSCGVFTVGAVSVKNQSAVVCFRGRAPRSGIHCFCDYGGYERGSDFLRRVSYCIFHCIIFHIAAGNLASICGRKAGYD